ncbi:MAG: hypothetical protein K9N55_15255 [Phycisphaerae bacterium]|nr:hypothetical protein [Phycisphaerae bacterium]
MSSRTQVLCTLALVSIIASNSSLEAKETSVPLDKDPALEAWWAAPECVML